MKNLGFLLLFMLLGTLVASDNADQKLKQGRKIFYKELGCKAINDAETRYECPDFKTTINKEKCSYDGEEFDLGVELDHARTSKYCQAACRCMKPFSGQILKFNCAHIDCPEFFGPSNLKGKNCVNTYEEGKCCRTGQVCDEELKPLEKCEFEGKTYYEGQKMYPDGDCYTCRCVKGFDNSTIAGNPNCHQDGCNIKQYHIEDIYNGCAPIYYKNVCCPIEYRCPSETDTVVSEGRSGDGVCKFGKLEIGLGGELNVPNQETTCRCVAPPLIECFKTPNYSK